jgi:creatinine amidohydrolase
MSTTGHDDMHGGELETSPLLHARPDLVRDTYRTADHDASERPHPLIAGMTEYTRNGIIGRPSLADATKGKAAVESLAQPFSDHLSALGR